MSHHRIAGLVVASALLLDAACGLLYAAVQHLTPLHGLYCALLNAVTVGGDVQPTSAPGYVINAAEALTVVPLFAATFSLFTSGLAAGHVKRSEENLKQHITGFRAPDSHKVVLDGIKAARDDIAGLAATMHAVVKALPATDAAPPAAEPATRPHHRPVRAVKGQTP